MYAYFFVNLFEGGKGSNKRIFRHFGNLNFTYYGSFGSPSLFSSCRSLNCRSLNCVLWQFILWHPIPYTPAFMLLNPIPMAKGFWSKNVTSFSNILYYFKKIRRDRNSQASFLSHLIPYPNPPRGTDLGTLVVLFQSGKE